VIKVLLADDQHLVRGALAALLTLEGDIEVVAEVGRGDELVQAARESGAEVALVDVEMPGLDGLAATAALHTALPSCRVLILTTFDADENVVEALRAGASGFLLKDVTPADFVVAIKTIAAGDASVGWCAAIAMGAATGPHHGSGRRNRMSQSSSEAGQPHMTYRNA